MDAESVQSALDTALQLWQAGQITRAQYDAAQAEYNLKMAQLQSVNANTQLLIKTAGLFGLGFVLLKAYKGR